MGQRAEWIEDPVIGHPHRIGTVFCQFLLDTREVVAQDDGLGLHTEPCGQLAALGQQFETHVGDLAALHLDIYEYVVHLQSALTERVARDKFDHQ